MRGLGFGLCLLALAGCALLRPNPLNQHRGALVLVFDSRTAGDLKGLREMLSHYDARATFFAAGQITGSMAGSMLDLADDGHVVGLSGLRGVDPQKYTSLYGPQKYFQDEILPQVLGAGNYGVSPRYYFLRLPEKKTRPETLKLPAFLVSKGFTGVVDLLPPHIPPTPVASVSAFHAYRMTTNVFDRAQIASLARRNEILIVAPDRQVLPELLFEARAQGVPFATVADLAHR